MSANNNTVSISKNVEKKPTDIARVAPKEAPLATPKVYGLANGFLNIAWKTKPEIARLAPTKKASIVLGALNFQKIRDSLESTAAENILDKLYIFDPKKGLNPRIKIVNKIQINRLSLLLI